jgi:hypothetical protein
VHHSAKRGRKLRSWDKEWEAAGSVMPSYLGHFCALLAQGLGVIVTVSALYVTRLSAARSSASNGQCVPCRSTMLSLSKCLTPLHVSKCLTPCEAKFDCFDFCTTRKIGCHCLKSSKGTFKETRTWYKHARYFFLICRQSTTPHYCLSAIRNPQLGRPRVLPLVLRAQVMRVCFIVFAARLVVIFWHFARWW